MNPIVVIIVVLVILFVIYIYYSKKNASEGFTADGLVFNIPPEWFRKPMYNLQKDWIVSYNPDQLSQPECLPYNRGDPEELNYLSSVYRFYRM